MEKYIFASLLFLATVLLGAEVVLITYSVVVTSVGSVLIKNLILDHLRSDVRYARGFAYVIYLYHIFLILVNRMVFYLAEKNSSIVEVKSVSNNHLKEVKHHLLQTGSKTTRRNLFNLLSRSYSMNVRV